MTSVIQHDKCMSVKNKNSLNIQCPYSRKEGSDYCGIHCRSKNVIRIDKKLQNSCKLKVISTSEGNDNNNQNIYSKVEMLSNFSKIRKSVLLDTLLHFKLLENRKTKMNKRQLYMQLYKYLSSIEMYSKYIKQIITIQKYYRKYSIYSRIKSINECDLLNLETVFLIPVKYLYKLQCNNGNLFCFDIRYLNQLMIDSKSPINPYTLIEFTSNEKEEINKRINLFKNKSDLMIDEPELDIIKDLELKIISVFKKFNDLDNYTDPKWFFNLSMNKLKDLYIIAEDVWNYRAQLPESKKLKILNNPKAFVIKVENIKKLNPVKDMFFLQNTIIDIFNRFVTEGIDKDEKKLGAMLMLTALVEVSIDAANAMPFLIQVN